jgi:hypothetical protein
MSKTETGKTENTPSARVLRDDELDAVNGGFSLGASQAGGIVVTKTTDAASLR